jgi:transposase-like protein
MIEKKLVQTKQQIISEYLSGDQSFSALSKKYGVNARTIQTWVRAFRKQYPAAESEAPADTDVKSLKRQLLEAQLKNELLEEMLRLSEEQTGIDFRKKYGTRQS